MTRVLLRVSLNCVGRLNQVAELAAMANDGIDGDILKGKFAAAVANVARNIELINELNVFPVPDGDTGINIHHTLQRAWKEIAQIDNAGAGDVAERFAYGALMGARGNSGTILSQLLTGFADGLADAQLLTAPLLRTACDMAVDRAYAAVSNPVEGTILTVAREASASLNGADTLDQALATLIASATTSLNNTPNLLRQLREAGVVDAGGMGLLCFLQGLRQHQCAANPVQASVALVTATNLNQPSIEPESFGYDVQFLMLGDSLDVARARRDLEAIGWSVIVVGDAAAIKVHIHVDNPALPLDYAINSGASLTDVVIENMSLQALEFTGRHTKSSDISPKPEIAVIAVAEGEGMKALYRELGSAVVIDGGASKNPSTEAFVKAIDQLASDKIVILPNNRNIFLAAQQAAGLRPGKRIRIVSSRSMTQGISAMIAAGDAGDSGYDLERMTTAMETASRELTSVEIARATRSTKIDGLAIQEDDYIAIVEGVIRVATGDLAETLQSALGCVGIEDKELVTLYYGAGLDQACASELIEHLLSNIKGIEFEAVDGGHPVYPLLVSIE